MDGSMEERIRKRSSTSVSNISRSTQPSPSTILTKVKDRTSTIGSMFGMPMYPQRSSSPKRDSHHWFPRGGMFRQNYRHHSSSNTDKCHSYGRNILDRNPYYQSYEN